MKTALITGSFDPITRGHADLIARTAAIFDRVEVVIFRNSEKTPLFSEEERLLWLSSVCADMTGDIRTAAADGTVVGYAKEKGVDCIVKGIRNGTDLDYEMTMYGINRAVEGVDTLFIPSKQEYMHISSTFVREMLRYEHDFTGLVPPAVHRYLCEEWMK